MSAINRIQFARLTLGFASGSIHLSIGESSLTSKFHWFLKPH